MQKENWKKVLSVKSEEKAEGGVPRKGKLCKEGGEGSRMTRGKAEP